MKFEVGKDYKLRNGKKCTITAIITDGAMGNQFPVKGNIDGGGQSWTSEGRCFMSSESTHDIVGEWTERDRWEKVSSKVPGGCTCPKENFIFIGGGCIGCTCKGV